MSRTTMMTNILPHDLVVDILSRLPVKTLLRFRCVSKPWNSFINDSSFIKMHLNHSMNNLINQHLMIGCSYLYSIAANISDESSLVDEVVEIDYPFNTPEYGVEILGSCNGLLLINSDYNKYSIWNPSTKEFKKLPTTPITFSNDRFVCRFTVYGFGYDEITEDYKVIRIILFDDDESFVDSEVKVYSLRSNSWRKIQDIPYNLTYRISGRFVNGALHWVADRISNSGEDVSYTVVSFNVGDEKYRVIEQPNYTDNKFHMNVDVLDECLCILCNYHWNRSEIWVMKDYGVKESWIKLITISQPTDIQSFEYVRPIKFTKNGEVVFEKDNNSLLIYDPKHGTAKTLKIPGMKDYLETNTYVESLIPLKSGTFVGQEQAPLEETLSNRKKKAMKRVSDRQARQQARERLYQ